MTLIKPVAAFRPSIRPSFRNALAAVWFAALLLAVVSCSSVSDIAETEQGEKGSVPMTPVPVADQTDNEAPVDVDVDADADVDSDAETENKKENSDGPELEAPSDNVSALAALITELPSAPIGAPAPVPQTARPTGLTIESLGVETAPVTGVGIEANGDMEIPEADEVGWYRYGPTPGQQGSSVLAAHIAFDGRNGVFVELDDIEIGATIEVSYEDGTTRRFTATDKQQYAKDELPRESVFGRSGESQLVLITCGGDFNRAVRSYEDNVVVYATPV
ncbi:MAG: class F sortase [Acidimicrobiales bacterium]